MEENKNLIKAKEKEELGLYEEALEYYTKAIEENPDNIEAYFGLNLIKSYMAMENIDDNENPKYKKHMDLFNIFNDILND